MESRPSPQYAFRRLLIVGLFVGLVAPPVFAQQANTANSNPPSTQSVPNNPPQSVPAGGYTYEGAYGQDYTGSRNIFYDVEVSFGPVTFGPYCLPPPPPFVGESMNQIQEALPARYPSALANHVGEIYYMALSDLVGKKTFSDRRLQRINSYLSARQSAAQVLRQQVSHALSLKPDEMRAMLAGIAEQQTAVLLAQELEAEAIRRDLTQVEPFKVVSDRITTLAPIENKDPDKNKILTARFVSLKAAQFQPGLSLEQRMLLQEYVGETLAADRAQSENGYLSFWPAGARIHVSITVPPALKARMDEFLDLKAKLKQELIAAVQREQNVVFLFSRTTAYEQLAQAQQEGFQKLDRLSEEIRQDLALLPNPDEPPASNLPADLTKRLREANEHKAALWRELRSTLNALRRELPTDQVGLVSQNESVSIVVTPGKDKEGSSRSDQDAVKWRGVGFDPHDLVEGIDDSKDAAARGLGFVFLTENDRSPRPDRKVVVAHLNAYNESLHQRFSTLATELDALRADIGRYQASLPQSKAPATVDELVANFVKSYKAQELWNRYRDYRTAVLLPGLSPAQRRLLFNAVQVDLFKESHSITP